MLPFVTELVTNGDERAGRGVTGLYLGPSLLVRGGVMMYIPETKRVSIRYSFAAREHIPLLSNLDITFASETMYGDLSEHNVSILVDQDEQLPAADQLDKPSEFSFAKEVTDQKDVLGEKVIDSDDDILNRDNNAPHPSQLKS